MSDVFSITSLADAIQPAKPPASFHLNLDHCFIGLLHWLHDHQLYPRPGPYKLGTWIYF